MKAILLLDAVHGASTPPARQLDEHRELARAAAELGFEGIVCGQHFLGAELRYYQPITYLAHLAHDVPSLRLVLGILLLPLLQPVQVAEDVATLDVVSGGRVTLGAAMGYQEHEMRAFGVEPGDRSERLEEGVALIKALWSGEPVEHRGRHFRVEAPTPPSVLPVQRPSPPIWIGGQSLPAVRRAARIGDAWYASPFPTHEALRNLREAFDDERAKHGLPPAVEFPVRRELLVASSKAAARRGAAERSRARYELYERLGLGARGGLRDAGGSLTEAGEEEAEGRFLLGTPEDCAEALARVRDDVGMTHFVFKPQWPGLPHLEAMRQLEAVGTSVLPLARRLTT